MCLLTQKNISSLKFIKYSPLGMTVEIRLTVNNYIAPFHHVPDFILLVWCK